VGMLDFATGAASAVRETVRKVSNYSYQKRRRPPRVCVGPKGLLPPYDYEQAVGQEYFFESPRIRDREEGELFSSYHSVSAGQACIITNRRVRFLNWYQTDRKRGKVTLSFSLEDVIKCSTEKKSVSHEHQVSFIVVIFYQEVVEEDVSSTDFPSFGPSKEIVKKKRIPSAHRIRCSCDRVALKICQLVNLAKSAYDKRKTANFCDFTSY